MIYCRSYICICVWNSKKGLRSIRCSNAHPASSFSSPCFLFFWSYLTIDKIFVRLSFLHRRNKLWWSTTRLLRLYERLPLTIFRFRKIDPLNISLCISFFSRTNRDLRRSTFNSKKLQLREMKFEKFRNSIAWSSPTGDSVGILRKKLYLQYERCIFSLGISQQLVCVIRVLLPTKKKKRIFQRNDKKKKRNLSNRTVKISCKDINEMKDTVSIE